MLQRIGDSHCVMEHAGWFRVIALVHLMVCSHVGLLKIVVFKIYQIESVTILKLGRGHGGDGDGIGKVKINGGSCVRSVDVLFSGAKDGLYGVSLTKL